MRNKTTAQFIEEAKFIHGDKYDYSLVNYITAHTKVKIICPIHGEFEQTPVSHTSDQTGCLICNIEKIEKDRELYFNAFKNKASIAHNNRYDYSESIYINNCTKVKIICPKHGEFFQIPRAHIGQKQGCPICKLSKGEIKVKEMLEDNKVTFIPQKTFTDCRGKKNLLPFDFYLPDYNTCIEYDGEQHFTGWNHNKDYLKLSQERDSIKTEYCNKNNIHLIRIAYNESIEDKLQPIFVRNFLEAPLATWALDTSKALGIISLMSNKPNLATVLTSARAEAVRRALEAAKVRLVISDVERLAAYKRRQAAQEALYEECGMEEDR
jgi:hypothetical protein